MNATKITVVIPTRERCSVLAKSLQTVTRQEYENLEILVSDNASGDETENVVRSAGDPRIRYVNTGRRLSMSHNWEFALSHVSDGWVTIIGDDDGLLPGALGRVASLIAETGVRAIRSNVCSYSWPSQETPFGRLTASLATGYEIRDCRTWLARLMSARAGYSDLPLLYNGGFVDFGVLAEIKRRTGSFYRSCVPDIYSAVAIASVAPQYAYSSEPFAINGASKYSTGASHGAQGTEKSGPAGQFAREGNIEFHPDVPMWTGGGYPQSITAIIYESYLQSQGLRSEDTFTDHMDQLEIAIATAGTREAATEAWGREFAARHGLEFEAARSRARRRKPALYAEYYLRRSAASLRTRTMGSAALPIHDVYDASIIAATVRNSPGTLQQLARLARMVSHAGVVSMKRP